MDWQNIAALAREAYREGVNDWIAKARVRGGRINGPEAILGAGALSSDAVLETKVLQALARSKVPPPIAQALAQALAAPWNEWAAQFQVRLPRAYPSFAAVPGPYAPPVLAAPVHLSLGSSSGEVFLNTALLSARLHTAMRAHAKLGTGSLVQSMTTLADWVDSSFQLWKPFVLLVGLVGDGPVVSFAPPYVPVGPVIMGEVKSSGPLFAGPRFGKIVL